MKNLKLIFASLLISCLGFMSCQDEIDNENGQNPNTNSADSVTASNLERSAQRDGTFDDFLDGTSCSSILLPVTATVNGQQVTIVSQADYQQVLDIFAQFNDDNDTVTLQFPITVQLSNYTEVVVGSQAEYDAIIDACEQAEAAGEDAIECLDIDFPITILTYSLNLDQTGSVVINSEQELYNYITNFDSDQLFAVDYPITATLNGDTVVSISSDLELQSRINECLGVEEMEEQAEEQADSLEEILNNGIFFVESFVAASVDTANDYAEFTIDFANDLTVTATNTVDQTAQDVQGTYEVTSSMNVFLSLNFSGNASFELMNDTWEVTSFSQTSINLQSTTTAGVTLVLSQL